MTLSLLGLSVSYVALAVLLALALIHSQIHQAIKATAAIGVCALYLIHYAALNGMIGWPSDRSLPYQFRLLAGEIHEPNPVIGREGEIFLWLTSLNDNVGYGTPRAYRLAYSRARHDNIGKALDKLGNGIPQMGLNAQMLQDSENSLPFIGRHGDVKDSIEFSDIPTTVLPEK